MSKPLDMSRMADAFSKPGIDPRKWCSYCKIAGNPEIRESSVFVSAIIQPEGRVVTLRVPPEYSGPGVGIWMPLSVGETVVAVFPDGNQDAGGIVCKRMWDFENATPEEVRNKPAHLWLIADRPIKIKAIGAEVIIQGELISLETTGNIATSKVFIDGVNAFQQFQTAQGPTVGAPQSNPLNPHWAALAEYKAIEGE